MADIPLPHQDLDRYFPKTGDEKFDRELLQRLTAAQQNFEELATQTARRLEAVLQQRVPPGCVFEYATTSPPIGYLTCDGSAVSRATYADLFAAIGTTHGSGDGSTTFNLPSYIGDRFPRGNATVGGTGGSDTHSHNVSTSVSTSVTGTASVSVSGSTGANSGPNLNVVTDIGGSSVSPAAHTHSVSASGGGSISGSGSGSGTGTADSQSNVPAYRDAFYIIKT